MKIYVGLTDKDWYEELKSEKAQEVNFWTPSPSAFNVLHENELFLFKLHSPYRAIVGGGFFVKSTLLPTFLAWQAFGEKNGVHSLDELNARIQRYRDRNRIKDNPEIGCRILTDVFYFDEHDWIREPADWCKSIVSGKGYDSETGIGMELYQQVTERLGMASVGQTVIQQENRYSESMTKHRLGQGAFRILVTDAYERRCAVTGEKTLPVLEAAHIRPYADQGPHEVDNGLLLRSDLHTLFDDGYITVDEDFRVDVSRKLHEDYGNGKDYYKYQGQQLLILPHTEAQRPSRDFLIWHNEHVFKG